MKIKNTDSLLILLMKLLAVSTVTMNYIIGESGHINWENSYTSHVHVFLFQGLKSSNVFEIYLRAEI